MDFIVDACNESPELAQKEARIRELEEAIRKFLEADMELDDKLNCGVGVEIPPNLYQAVGKAIRGLLDILSDKSNQSDKEK